MNEMHLFATQPFPIRTTQTCIAPVNAPRPNYNATALCYEPSRLQVGVHGVISTGRNPSRLSALTALACLIFLTGLPASADGPIGPVIQPTALNDARKKDAQSRAEGAAAQGLKGVPAVPPTWRQIGNGFYDISKIIAWERNLKTYGFAAAGERPMKEWVHLTANQVTPALSATVRDNVNNQVHVSYYSGGNGPSQYMVSNPPKFPMAVGSSVDWFVRVRSISGLTAYCDYGVPISAAQMKAMTTEPIRQMTTEELEATTKRVVAYQLGRASNGYPSFQYEVGKRYLNGDGVEKDLALARYWLRSACTNGLSEATNLLFKIP